MKKTSFLFSMFVVLALTVINCGENGSPVKSNADTLDPCVNVDESHLCAKVENASEFNNVVEVRLMVFERYDTTRHSGGLSITTHDAEVARGEWKNGGFIIEFPETLTSDHLRPLIGARGANHPTNIYNAQSTMATSNENVRVADASFVGVDKNGNAVATFSPVKTDRNGTNETILTYTYVDSDVTISGYTKEEGHAHPACPDCPGWYERTTTYSIEWKKGWNTWYTSTSHATVDYTAIATKQWTNTFEGELKWSGKIYEN